MNEKIKQNKGIIKLLHHTDFEKCSERIVHNIRLASEGRYALTVADWSALYNAVDSLYPTLKEQLISKMGTIDEQEMKFCYLTKIELTNHQIQHITNLSRTTIWRWTKRFTWILAEE